MGRDWQLGLCSFVHSFIHSFVRLFFQYWVGISCIAGIVGSPVNESTALRAQGTAWEEGTVWETPAEPLGGAWPGPRPRGCSVALRRHPSPEGQPGRKQPPSLPVPIVHGVACLGCLVPLNHREITGPDPGAPPPSPGWKDPQGSPETERHCPRHSPKPLAQVLQPLLLPSPLPFPRVKKRGPTPRVTGGSCGDRGWVSPQRPPGAGEAPQMRDGASGSDRCSPRRERGRREGAPGGGEGSSPSCHPQELSCRGTSATLSKGFRPAVQTPRKCK